MGCNQAFGALDIAAVFLSVRTCSSANVYQLANWVVNKGEGNLMAVTAAIHYRKSQAVHV